MAEQYQVCLPFLNKKTMNNKLYSDLPVERLVAGLKITDETNCKFISNKYPHLWFGSPNAWVVFLGSSPGDSDREGNSLSHYTSEISFKEASAHLSKADADSKGFWKKIKEYRKTIFPEIMDDVDACRLTLAGNLIIDKKASNSDLLNSEELDSGAEKSYEVLKIVKPKLVICLEKKVFVRLIKNARNDRNNINENKPFIVQGKYKPEVAFMESNTDWAKWVLTRVPMHPSRHYCNPVNFKEQYLTKLVTLTNEYLGLDK